ncbi:hypothetical protein COLO4_14909 [Corchorus olitorius]|uniref:PGG domain-containing protein n=1 Tax=Corchorus olitorius TaxID=93759 RepID=A0A1R3JQB6_9ROSI|nr:hypothetical protein COLO4_14909 [Corchorus olitorius]
MAASEHESKSGNGDSIYNMLSNCGGSLSSSLAKIPNPSDGGNWNIRSWLQEKPNSSIKNIDSFRSKVSSFGKVKTAIVRGRGEISESMRNTFLVVTVLIITATYTASLDPPKKEQQYTPTEQKYNTPYYTSPPPGPPSSSSGATASSSSSSSSGTGSTSSATSSATVWSSSSSSSSGSVPLGLELPDLYSLFWLYNTLTFWASVWLTAFLLPANSIFSLFLLIALSLFGSCYMLLMVAISSDLQFYDQVTNSFLIIQTVGTMPFRS